MKCERGRFLKNVSRQNLQSWALTTGLVLASFYVSAQDGVAGLNEANQKVRSYFVAGTT